MREFRFHQANLQKHNVTPEEAYECFLDPAGFKQRSSEGSYILIAKTAEEDILHLAFRIEPDKSIYVFHGRPASTKERRRYKDKGK